MTNKREKRLKEVQELSRNGDLVGAEKKLIHFLKDYPESTVAAFMLAGVYWNLNEFEKAEFYLRKTPKGYRYYPLAVSSLFHILWETGSKIEAMRLLNNGMAEANPDDPQWQRLINDFTEIREELKEKGIWVESDVDLSPIG